MGFRLNDFKSKDISSFDQFREEINKLEDTHLKWIFRGQPPCKELKTALERALEDYGICLNRAKDIENRMIRDFKRRYIGLDNDRVLSDTLFCIALMQHYGAPTRLLDWTYSPYVAAFFTLEKKLPKATEIDKSVGNVWALNTDWCEKEAKKVVGKTLIDDRNIDGRRNDKSFKQLYMGNLIRKFIFIENPLLLNERLIIQQGVFLCPGDISEPLENNIKSMSGWEEMENIVKFDFKFDVEKHKRALLELMRMNIGRDSLFPGLQGFSESFKQRLLIYDGLIDKKRKTER